jgi:phage tail P2-like protein
MNNLLPSNATPQEVALAGAVASAVPVPVPNADLYNPALCPEALLPWLAWAFSLDEWSPEWTTEQKRQAIAASVYVHRHKGTVGALRKQLDALGYDLTLTEWHQLQPKGDPYTFGVDIEIHDVGFQDEDAFNQVITVANNAKNVRSHMTFLNMHTTRDGQIYSGGVAVAGETVSVDSDPESLVMSDFWADGIANGFSSTLSAVGVINDATNNYSNIS